MQESITKWLGPREKDQLKFDSRYALYTEYEAESLGDPMSGLPYSTTKQAYALEKITLTNLAFWLICPSALQFNLAISADKHSDSGKWFLRQCSEEKRFQVTYFEENKQIEKSFLAEVTRVSEKLITMIRKGAFWISTRSLIQGLKSDYWELRILLSWIALEALFGSSDARETTHRLAHRAASFLCNPGTQTYEAFRLIKQDYGLRSSIVHGMLVYKKRDPSLEQINDYIHWADCWIRMAFIKILSSSDLIDTFNGKGREEYLDHIVFGIQG